MKVNIKDVKIGQVVQFDRHAHWVINDELICDFMCGTVMADLSQNGKDWNGQVIVNLHNSEHRDKLEEFDTGIGKNNLIFLFPDEEEMYKDVVVTIINEAPTATYGALIPVSGFVRAHVKANSPQEALRLFKNNEYDSDDFTLDDYEAIASDLTVEDVVFLDAADVIEQ